MVQAISGLTAPWPPRGPISCHARKRPVADQRDGAQRHGGEERKVMMAITRNQRPGPAMMCGRHESARAAYTAALRPSVVGRVAARKRASLGPGTLP